MSRRHIAAGLILACSGACAHGRQLVPATTAMAATHIPDAAVDHSAGVELVARAERVPPGDEPGMRAPGSQVARFRIWLINRSRLPLQIRFESFVLAAADGSQYRAVPLFPAHGMANPPAIIRTPGFEQENFEIAPYLADVYPGLWQYCGAFSYDPLYYGRYYDPGLAVRLSASELQEALPEGVLQPEGRLIGTLYFQSPSAADLDSGKLELKAALAPQATEPAVARLSLPFRERMN